MVTRTPAVPGPDGNLAPQTQDDVFPLTPIFQDLLLKMLVEDREFSAQVSPYIRPVYFAHPAHQWAWKTAVDYREQYGAVPTLHWLFNAVHTLPPGQREVCAGALQRVQNAPPIDLVALKEFTVDFLQQALFRQAHLDSRDLFNAGRRRDAYRVTREALTALDSVSLQRRGRSWLGERFVDRQLARVDGVNVKATVGTGFPLLDRLLDGGAYPGFLGIWLAHPKAGKSALLINLGAVAMLAYGKRVFHAVLEGDLSYIEDRYDALFSGEKFSVLRRGDMSPERYAKTYEMYSRMAHSCVVQDYTADWDCTVEKIHADLQDLERNHGWKPDVVLIDYVDLLRGRGKQYKSPSDEAEDVTKDTKKLASLGYVVWTASQVQRPKDKDFAEQVEILKSVQIAGCYARVRIADFVGSINQTLEERRQGVMRLYAELFRNGAADVVIPATADFSVMRMGPAALPAGEGTPPPTVPRTAQLGYGAVKQSKIGGG